MCDCNQKEPSDRQLVERIKRGEISGFDHIFGKHRRGILVYVKGITGRHETAEEITQDCFIRFIEKIDSIDPRRSISGWLYRTARNMAIDAIRRSRFEVISGEDLFRPSGETDEDPPDRELERKEDRAGVMLLLAAVPVEEREVLTLRFFNELRFREIGEILERPLGTVLWQARRGLERMKEMSESNKEDSHG